MQRQPSNLPVYLALSLALLAAITSSPTVGKSFEARLVSVVLAGAAAEDGQIYMDELQALGLP